MKLSALGVGIIFILYSLIQNDSFANSLPLVALYAFGGYRILPALQQSYNSLSNLRFAGPALDNLCEELKLNSKILSEKHIDPMPLKKNINLKNISYKYPNTINSSINDINLDIPAYSTVGLVGATGSENFHSRHNTWSP